MGTIYVINKKTNRIWALCCVHLPWHTAKKPANSASDHYLPCANTLVHDKDLAFAVCQAGKAHGKDPCHIIRPVAREILPWVTLGTRQRLLPCAREVAHGKGWLCRCLFAVCPLPCAAHDKSFAMYFLGVAVCQSTRQTHSFRSDHQNQNPE